MLQRATSRINDALNDVRNISHRLRPAELDTLGLASALRRLGEEMCSPSGIVFELTADEALTALPDEIRTTLFRVAQEALTNVVKHAGATQVRVSLNINITGLSLAIEDNGKGFDLEAVAGNPRQGIGLRNMRERLVSIGGRLQINARPQQTTVLAEVPDEVVSDSARSAQSCHPDARDHDTCPAPPPHTNGTWCHPADAGRRPSTGA